MSIQHDSVEAVNDPLFVATGKKIEFGTYMGFRGRRLPTIRHAVVILRGLSTGEGCEYPHDVADPLV